MQLRSFNLSFPAYILQANSLVKPLEFPILLRNYSSLYTKLSSMNTTQETTFVQPSCQKDSEKSSNKQQPTI